MDKITAMHRFLLSLKVMVKYDHDFPPIIHRDIYMCFWTEYISSQFNNPTFLLLNRRVVDRVHECKLQKPPKLTREEWYTLAKDLGLYKGEQL